MHIARELIDSIRPVVKHAVVEWIQQNIDLTNDMTSARGGLVDLSLTPYTIEPMSCWDDPECRYMVVIAIEQSGKSSCWKWPMLWSMANDPAPGMIIYPSDDDAADTNQDSVEPLMRSIPKLARELERPNAKRKDCYKFRDSITYFSGAGAAIISKPIKRGVADEVDFWVTMGDVDNVRNLEKRMRTYPDSLYMICTSPTLKSGPGWTQFQKTSRGYWHLQCQGCGELMPSYDIRLMQWELNDDGRILLDTLSVECPSCQHAHRESDRQSMNTGGDFIHREPDQKMRRGFQWGAMASPFIPWLHIAESQMEAGQNSGRDAQMYLDNSIKGLPWSARRKNTETINQIRSHCATEVNPEVLCGMFLAADTQDNGWYWVVRAVDEQLNTHLIAYGFAYTLDELDKEWNTERMGIQIASGIIDEGGHRTKEVRDFVSGRPGLNTYKGDARIGKKWKRAKEIDFLILANPYHYQGELLYLIYSQDDRANNYWFLPDNVGEDYIDQIASMQPNKKVKHGDEYEKWEAPEKADDHYFDCEKMMRVLIDVAIERFTENDWHKPPPYMQRTTRKRRTPQVKYE